jgi:hypothetical protein
VVVPKRRGPGVGHAAEVAAGLVPVAQLLRHRAKIERDGQQQRIAVAQPALARRQRLFEHAARPRSLACLHVQAGQLMSRGEHLLMVLPVGDAGPFQRGRQRGGGAGDIPGVAPAAGIALGRGQGRRGGHVHMLPGCGRRRQSGVTPGPAAPP